MLGRPEFPYFIHSEKHNEKEISLEKMMFDNYLKIVEAFHNPEIFNEWHAKHRIKWLMEKGEDRPIKVNCEKCIENKASYIAYRKVYLTKKDVYKCMDIHTFCDSCAVEYNIRNSSKGPNKYKIAKPVFSSILEFSCPEDRKIFIKKLKEVLGAPKRITHMGALEFFLRNE